MFTKRPFSKRVIALVIGASLVVAACSSEPDTISLSDGAIAVPASDAGDVEVTSEVINFAYDDFDGALRSLDELPPGPVVLNFFASWCSTCIAEMPDFETVSQDMAGDVTFLGLSVQDRVESAIDLVAETGVTYPVGNDQNGEIFTQVGALGMPTTVFIRADRTIASVHSGVLDVESLTDMINQELLS